MKIEDIESKSKDIIVTNFPEVDEKDIVIYERLISIGYLSALNDIRNHLSIEP